MYKPHNFSLCFLLSTCITFFIKKVILKSYHTKPTDIISLKKTKTKLQRKIVHKLSLGSFACSPALLENDLLTTKQNW